MCNIWLQVYWLNLPIYAKCAINSIKSIFNKIWNNKWQIFCTQISANKCAKQLCKQLCKTDVMWQNWLGAMLFYNWLEAREVQLKPKKNIAI